MGPAVTPGLCSSSLQDSCWLKEAATLPFEQASRSAEGQWHQSRNKLSPIRCLYRCGFQAAEITDLPKRRRQYRQEYRQESQNQFLAQFFPRASLLQGQRTELQEDPH